VRISLLGRNFRPRAFIARGRFLFGEKMLFSKFAIALCFAAPLLAQAGSSSFRAKSVTRSGTIRLHGPIDQVFPLFGPVREKDWAPGWNPRILAPLNRDVAEGMVFTVQEPEGTAYWMVTQFDATEHLITYANVTPGFIVNRIVIRCRPVGPKETEAVVAYTHPGLSDPGNRFAESQTEGAYAAKMQHWQIAINHLLTTGKRIELSH
jgi:hypothetical protein